MDAKINEAIEEVRGATARLRALCIETSLCAEYRARTTDLDQEDRRLEAERGVLSESRANLEPITEGKVKVLGREADQLAAGGNIEGAATKRDEARQVRESYEGIQGKIDQTDARRRAIREDRRKIARQIWETNYPNLPTATFAMIEAAVDFLDSIEAGMYEYQKLVGLEPGAIGSRPLVTRPALENLTPTSPGPSRVLAGRARKWFGHIG